MVFSAGGVLLGSILASGYMAFFNGGIQVRDAVNFTNQNGTSTGVNLKVAGLTRLQTFSVPVSQTGGNVKVSGGAKYDTAYARSPFTTTGTLVGLALECGGVPKPFAYEVGFVKSRLAGTGSRVHANLDNKTAASGSLAVFLTGATLWNPADAIKLGTLTSVPVTSANDCKLWITASDKYGS